MQEIQNKIIFEELCVGKILPESKKHYLEAIAYFESQKNTSYYFRMH